MDIRTLKTKEKVRSGLLELLPDKRVEDVTVTELCRMAGVNRSTFYVYYDTVTDVFGELVDLALQDMSGRMTRSSSRTAAVFLNIYLDTAREHPKVFGAIHSYDIDHFAIRKMTELAAGWLDPSVIEQVREDRMYFTFWYSGYFGLIREWLKNGCRESNEEVIDVLRRAGMDANRV